MAEKDERGAAGEQRAAAYLAECGYEVVARNWRCSIGEIDLVAVRGRRLVVVEVKTRRNLQYGDPLSAVDARKLARLWRLAHAFIHTHDDLAHGRTLQVDVIGITGERPETGELVHLEDVR